MLVWLAVIQLSRGGSKDRPFYKIVAAEERVRHDGAFIERMGFSTPAPVVPKKACALPWIA
ncbi:SSU ribosomal protein S16p [Comamonas testosteroni]|nr:SSU ribosomal protein S16p [Comamonas testosteroni]